MAFVAICLSALVVSAMSFAGTDFSGAWELDKSKSEGLGGPQGGSGPDSVTWTITQDAKTITIATKTMMNGQERSQSLTYNLDGSETTAEVPGRGGQMSKVALKAKWQGDGKILELTRTRSFNEMQITTTEHLELAEGGKVLKAHSSTQTQQGSRETKYLFNKK